jgi:glycosyltransferase involved in cell wall biosynthesis
LTVSLAIAAASLAIWLYLVAGRGDFWRASVRDDTETQHEPRSWPPVAAVVPARNEAEFIPESLGSLLALDYPGSFDVILVDDQSTDGSAAVAYALADANRHHRLTVLAGRPLPRGWTGKLWAMQQGADHSQNLPEPPHYLLFTDADIAFARDTLRRIVARAEAGGRVLGVCTGVLQAQIGNSLVGFARIELDDRGIVACRLPLREQPAGIVTSGSAARQRRSQQRNAGQREDERKAERVDAQLSPYLVLEARHRWQDRLGLSHVEIGDLVAMGPSAWHTGRDEVARRVAAFPDPAAVTASLTLSVYRRRDTPSA